MRQRRPSRLSSWRQVAEGIERLPTPRQASGGTDTLLRAHQRRLQLLCLTTVQEHHAFFASLLAVVQQLEGVDPVLKQQVIDLSTHVLREYSLASSLSLRIAIEQETKRFLQVVSQQVTVGAVQQQLPDSSWIHRALNN